MDIDLLRFINIFFLCFCTISAESIKYYPDDAPSLSINKYIPDSHIKIYLPSIAYSYIMRLVNGTLVRLDNSKQGWEYYIAYKHKKINELTYDFWLRDDVKFQDGTPLTTDVVIENLRYFIKGAFQYTDIHHRLKSVEKIGPYHIRLHLNSPYGMLLNDLARINIYTLDYYKLTGWTRNITGENTRIPGPYGAGPYILIEGNATGLVQSDTIVLKANPYYFEKGKPYIDKITIYTRLPIDEAIDKIANHEAELDIAIIPFDKKTEIVNSKYAKLITSISSNNISIHMNLMRKESVLNNKKIRQALNEALNQENLIKFIYKNEGTISPFPISANSFYAKDLSETYSSKQTLLTNNEMSELLKGLHLKVLIQDRFCSLFKGIEYQLKQYGVKIDYEITYDEKDILKKLLNNRANKYDWDLLVWANDDWYVHPWGMLFGLYTKNEWSAIEEDFILDQKLKKLFEIEPTDVRFQPLVNDILVYIYNQAYMLSVPSPNVVMAINKEVDFIPSPIALMRLWDAKITPYHWSIRGKMTVPEERYHYIIPQKMNTHE